MQSIPDKRLRVLGQDRDERAGDIVSRFAEYMLLENARAAAIRVKTPPRTAMTSSAIVRGPLRRQVSATPCR
jgi:hypothetical protein